MFGEKMRDIQIWAIGKIKRNRDFNCCKTAAILGFLLGEKNALFVFTKLSMQKKNGNKHVTPKHLTKKRQN